MKIKKFVFNSFQVNTYVVYDDTLACVIIDPACESKEEQTLLLSFVKEQQLKPVAVLNTHGHVDHVLGNKFVSSSFDVPVYAHEADFFLIREAVSFAAVFGMQVTQPDLPDKELEEGISFVFGNSSLEILHVPGHSPGSVVLYNREHSILLAGDVLFEGSIGRTDLPMGDYDGLIRHITSKVLSLPEKTVVYPGHGNPTTIVKEKKSNPFLTGRA